MPTVDKKHFKYTKKGIEKAKDYAKKTGKKLKSGFPAVTLKQQHNEGYFSNIATLKSEVKRLVLAYEKAKNEYNAIMAGQGRGSEHAAARKVKQLWLSVKEVEKDMAAALKPLEGMVEQKITGAVGLKLDEVGISALHKHIKSGKTIEQIAKLMRLSVQTVKNLTKGLLKNSTEQVKRYAGTWTSAYEEVQERAKKVDEEVLKEFTDAHIASLKKDYEPFRGKSITPSAANKLRTIFDKIPNAVLKKLKDADIPFLSSMALTKMILKGMPTKE